MKTTRLVTLVMVSALLGAGCEDKVPEPTPSARPEKSAEPTFEAPKELIKEDVKVGDGPEAETGDEVKVHYTGRLLKTNAKFDSSLDRKDPFTFKLGEGAVIKGWDQGVVGMKVGGKRTLIIPPELGYGSRGAGGVIPPNATLVFDVELLGVR